MVLCRPVQSEIDALKEGGNTRRAKRSRLTSSVIRELLAEPKALRERAPAVRLILRHDLRRDESAAQDLDYSERDDQFVGIALAFKNARPDVAVRLLTNDTGPMASANMVGLEFVEVPENWLLEPESDENDKREKELRDQLARYKQAEPQFELTVIEPASKRIEAAMQCFASLTDAEVEGLMACLAEENPVASDFGPREAPPRSASLTGGGTALYGIGREMFEPASEKKIENYKAAHENWLDSCREYLSVASRTIA
ncbi:PIN domain-containing protein [Acidovorax sp. NPDC077664]|uniref:PIN domain-containing protein n=1 Tax=Acidovorax sp. NPDC077664 TaxID=3390544 RepID=UPI003CFD67CC